VPAPQPEAPRHKWRLHISSLQTKYAMSYLVLFAVVLILLNTYPVLACQDLLFGSKRDAMKGQAAVISSALMELESLSAEQVEKVMNMLDNTGLSRIMVTDPSGLILYDSRQVQPHPSETDTPIYHYALLQEVVQALRGYDVFHSEYTDYLFASSAATPIVYRGMTIGALYIYEEDATQGALLRNLQQNLKTISLVIAGITLLTSAIFSRVLTGRITALLKAIRIVGEGEYGHRLQSEGNDELAQLAEEFNHLSDRLQVTEEIRRRFVSDASHELKTPLASIRLLSDSILQNQGMEEETVRDFVSDIGQEAERLTRITEHLLTLSRLDSLPMGETEPVDLTEVIGRVLSMLVPVADAEGILIQTDPHSGCIVRATQDDLHQICFNLVENAIKYNVPNGKINIRWYRDDDQVILEVADTGMGIPEKDLTKVFNRFYRVDKARSRAAGGTGLGLSIVRDTVRRHNGWVTVRPNHPQGSLFSVGFPHYTRETEEGGHDS